MKLIPSYFCTTDKPRSAIQHEPSSFTNIFLLCNNNNDTYDCHYYQRGSLTALTPVMYTGNLSRASLRCQMSHCFIVISQTEGGKHAWMGYF
mgnify:CR=1 FL=1